MKVKVIDDEKIEVTKSDELVLLFLSAHCHAIAWLDLNPPDSVRLICYRTCDCYSIRERGVSWERNRPIGSVVLQFLAGLGLLVILPSLFVALPPLQLAPLLSLSHPPTRRVIPTQNAEPVSYFQIRRAHV